jgi:hypothetical protein
MTWVPKEKWMSDETALLAYDICKNEQKPLAFVAKNLGVNVHTLSHKLTRMGLGVMHLPGRNRGTLGLPRLLSKEQELQIVDAYQNNGTNSVILANKYNVCVPTILNALRRHNVNITKYPKYVYKTKNGKSLNLRSSYEVAFAKYLDSKDVYWEYEPKTFKLSSGKRYTPDFRIPEWNQTIEIKGRLKGDAKEKIDAFRKEFPDQNLILLNAKALKDLYNIKFYKHTSVAII